MYRPKPQKKQQRCLVEKPKPRPRKPKSEQGLFYSCGPKVMFADVLASSGR
jgi:hypothetical protein